MFYVPALSPKKYIPLQVNCNHRYIFLGNVIANSLHFLSCNLVRMCPEILYVVSEHVKNIFPRQRISFYAKMSKFEL